MEVGVLTDDRERAASQIIHLIFNRWTQENDFKYLDEHFGINQITSYASVAYEKLQGQVEQKQSKSGAYKALEQKAAQLKSQLSKLLLSQHQHPRKSTKRAERIAALTQDLAQTEQDQAKTQKEVSRLEVLIEQQMVRLDTRNKQLLDSLRLIARNAFYQTLQPFKTAYNNYRDDHELFRNLTQADGVLVESEEQVEAYLLADGQLSARAGENRERAIDRDQHARPQDARRIGPAIAVKTGRKNGTSSCDCPVTKNLVLLRSDLVNGMLNKLVMRRWRRGKM